MSNDQNNYSTAIPDYGLISLKTVLKVFPVCRSMWWEGIAKGIYPKPVPLGKRKRAWRVEDIKALVQNPPKF